MLSRPLLSAALVSLALTSSTFAGELRVGAKAVVELFTSQGCSSCPKADAMLEQMGKRPEIVALAYHVDYWDYIGWQDTFGTKENSDRQRDYAHSWGSTRIFTPQLVVNGAGGVVASKQQEVQAAVDKASLPLTVDLAQGDGDMLEVSIPGQEGHGEAAVWLVTFLDHAEVEIERGENQGKKVGYSQIVTGRQVLGMWDPQSGAHLKLPLDEVLTGKSNGAVIMVQAERNGLPGPILGAASFTR